MQVRKVVTGTTPRVGPLLRETRESMGCPSLAWESSSSLWSADEPATYPTAGDNPAAPALIDE